MNGIKYAVVVTAVVIGLSAYALPARASAAQDLEPRLEQALMDEYHAQAFYGAVLAQYGDVRPFSNIYNAEGRHIDALLAQYDSYGWDAPANPYSAADFEFSSLEDAAQQARDAEVANADLYAGLFDGLNDPQVSAVFSALQRASQENHLPALERYLNGECTGMGNQQGRGQGNGYGKGKGNGNGKGNGSGNGKGKGKGKGKGNGNGRGKGNGGGGCRR
jgi:hypothetical protein